MCLPAKLSKDNGSIGPICICTRVTRVIQLIDPKTLKGEYCIYLQSRFKIDESV